MSEPALPLPPRTLTRAARRQSWREVPVRAWLLVTLGVAVVIFAVGWRNVRDGLADRQLRRSGVRVDALVEGIGNFAGSRNVDRSIARPIDLSYTLPGESEPHVIHGTSSPIPGHLNLHETIPIWVDPYDSTRWTDRVDDVGWASLLAVPLLLTPAVVVLALLMGRRRNRFLRTWRDGASASGTVAEVQTSPLVPGQRVLHVALPAAAGDASAARSARVTLPGRLAVPARGDVVEVIVDARGQAVLAAAYA